MVVPPDMAVLAYRSFLMSTSHLMELKVVSWMPQASIPRKLGWKRASGHLNLSFPMVMTWVGKLVGLLQGGGGGGSGHLLLEVQGDVAQLLLDVTDDLPLGGGGEGVAPLGEDPHQVVGQLTASQVQTDDGVGKGVTLVDGDAVGDTVTGVHDDTGGTARGVQGEHSLDGDVHGGHVEGLEHDLGHLLPVGLGVEGGFGQEDPM